MAQELQLKKSHEAAGATFIDVFGWEIPERFSSIGDEYEAVRNEVGLLDLSYSILLELSGDDRTRFLHGMLTSDIKSLSAGQGCYAAALTPQGRLIADLKVFCSETSLLLVAEASVREKLEPSLRKYIIGGRPELRDRSDEFSLLSLQGPKAAELLSRFSSDFISKNTPFDHIESAIAGVKSRICRVNRTLPGGFDIIVSRKDLVQTWSTILEAGRPFGVQAVGFASLNIHRIEAGLPLYGFDMDENTLPIEAGLERNAISFNKGCYIGQESVARITYRGHVNRKLSGLLGNSDRVASKGDKVFKEEQEVGWITSSAFSPRLERAISLGYLRREVLEARTPLRIEHNGENLETFVSALPFS